MLSVGLVFFSGCKKADTYPGKVTFKGYLMKSCDTAMSRHTMWVDYYFRDMANTVQKGNIGSDTSKDNGYFEIVCSNEGEGSYSFIIDGTKKFQYSVNGPWGDNFTVDLGKIICDGGTIQSHGLIRFAISNPKPSDTLYVGYGNLIKQIIYPVSTNSYYPISGPVNTNTLPYATDIDIIWGRGLHDYEVATDSFAINNGNQYHRIKGKLNVCGYIDTVVVAVP